MATRRSARKPVANTKYSDQAWDRDAIRLLRDSETGSSSSPSESDHTQEIRDDEFAVRLDERLQNDSSSDNEDYLANASDGSHIVTPDEADSDLLSDASDQPGLVSRQQPSHADAGSGQGRIPKPVISFGRSRGLPNFNLKVSPSASYEHAFGNDPDDLRAVLHARDTWLKARDITLPSRTTLAAASSASIILGESPGQADNGQDVRLDVHKLYADQQLQPLSQQDAFERGFLPASNIQSMAVGPTSSQQTCRLMSQQWTNLGAAWRRTEPARSSQAPVGISGGENAMEEEPAHSGWVMNVGDKIQSISWAPRTGSIQYLAITARPSSRQRAASGHPESSKISGFHASPDYRSNIQIWSFATGSSFSSLLQPDFQHLPRLSSVICTEVGVVRSLKWAPEEGSDRENNAKTGLHRILAMLSSDGHARLLAIKLGLPLDNVPILYQKSAAIDIAPPANTTFTTMAFATPTDLVLGDSTGSISVYSLLDPSTPSLTVNVHRTYLMSLATCPTHPHFLCSSAANGAMALTDLRSPSQDHINLPRARLPTAPLVYTPFTQSFLTTIDHAGRTENTTFSSTIVIHNNLRQFNHTTTACALPRMTGGGTTLAASNHHPCILVGNAKGDVFATNFLRKCLPRKARRKEEGGFLQKIVECDFLPPKPSSSIPGNATDGGENDGLPLKPSFHGPDVRAGTSRFTEGFKPEYIDLYGGGLRTKASDQKHKNRTKKKGSSAAVPIVESPGAASKKKTVKTKASVDNMAGDIIYEEEQCVVALEWNPNFECAGWAAIAWGSGILRIQDLSHDLT